MHQHSGHPGRDGASQSSDAGPLSHETGFVRGPGRQQDSGFRQAACVPDGYAGGLRGALASGWELPISGHRFWALAVAGDRVYGNGGTDDGIYVADVADRSVHRVSSESGASAVGWMAANDVALTQLTYDSPSDPTKWSLYAAEPEGGNVRKIAGSPKDQQDGQGRATQPALAGHHLAWTQSRPGTAASDLRVLDLRTGKAVTVATGDILPPVAMGATFVWPERASSQAWTFKAVDSTSLRKVALPSGLPTTGDGIGQVAGTPDKLIWGSSDFLTLNVWDKPSGRVARYETDPTSEHVFQFMKPTGSLLPGTPHAVQHHEHDYRQVLRRRQRRRLDVTGGGGLHGRDLLDEQAR